SVEQDHPPGGDMLFAERIAVVPCDGGVLRRRHGSGQGHQWGQHAPSLGTRSRRRHARTAQSMPMAENTDIPPAWLAPAPAPLWTDLPGGATPYVDLGREAWSALAESTPLPLTAEELARIAGLGDPIDLAE